MKSGKAIFNIDQDFSEYVNNNKNEEDEDPFAREYWNNLLKNEEEFTIKDKNDQDDLEEIGKFSSENRKLNKKYLSVIFETSGKYLPTFILFLLVYLLKDTSKTAH